MIEIRLPRTTDAAGCAELAALALGPDRAGPFIKSHMERHHLIVAEADKEIVGFLAYRTDWFQCTFVSLVVVREDFRRKGIAREFFKSVEAVSPSPRVFSSTEETNAASIRMHTTLRARWGIVAAPALLYIFSYFHRVAPVVVASDLMQAFAIPAAALGTLIAVYPYCFVVMALPNGTLADTLGPRRMLALGGVTMAAGSMLFGAAPAFWVAFAGRLLVGLGASAMLIASLRLASEWFRPHEFATVAGSSQSIGAFGAIVGTGPLALVVEAIGWRLSFIGIGAITLLLAMACYVFIRDRPEDLGLPRVAEGPRVPAPSLRETLEAIPGIAANPRSWPILLMGLAIYGAFVPFFGLWGVPYLAQVYGMSRVGASNVLMMTALGLLISAPLIGWISDRWLGLRRPPLIAATALFAAVWALLALPRTPVPPEWLSP